MNSNGDMDTKKQLIGGIVVALIIGGIIWWGLLQNKEVSNSQVENIYKEALSQNTEDSPVSFIDIKNIDYKIDSRLVKIRDGVATESLAQSGATIRTSLLEGPAFADIDLDGKKDAVVILRDEPGGTGIFYYASVVLANANPMISTNSVLLGDRIRIKEIVITGEMIKITILERLSGEAMTKEPSIEKTLLFRVVEGSLIPLSGN